MQQKGNCNKTSDNKYFDCPAVMSDGRAFTDYRPSTTVDDMIRIGNNVRSNYEYRQFLTNNATAIITITSIRIIKKAIMKFSLNIDFSVSLSG